MGYRVPVINSKTIVKAGPDSSGSLTDASDDGTGAVAATFCSSVSGDTAAKGTASVLLCCEGRGAGTSTLSVVFVFEGPVAVFSCGASVDGAGFIALSSASTAVLDTGCEDSGAADIDSAALVAGSGPSACA